MHVCMFAVHVIYSFGEKHATLLGEDAVLRIYLFLKSETAIGDQKTVEN